MDPISSLNSKETLKRRLEQEPVFSPIEAVSILIELCGLVKEYHADGRLCGGLEPENILFSDEQIELRPSSSDVISLQEDGFDEQRCPPLLCEAKIREVPRGLVEASKLIEQAGVRIDPIQIDLYRLGVLLCQLLTGTSVGSYFCSPRTKASVPDKLNAILARALGLEQNDGFSGIDELSDALSAAAEEIKEPGSKATGDTSPSMVVKAHTGNSTIVIDRNPERSRSDDLPFQTIGHYEILERLGRGGMGDVFKGYERSLDRVVAIKVLPTEFTRHEDFVRRFYAEATAAARLSHPNVIDIYFIGEDHGTHFFSMQFVDGDTLATLIARQKRFAFADALPIWKQSLEGLAAAHKRGLIHRDIKPGNILIRRDDRHVLVADFGLVKSIHASDHMTATGMVMGTADYISPEQGRGKPVDTRSDLYSMGVVMFHMISGELPFEADNPTAMIFQHVYERPPLLHQSVPGTPPPISCIIDKLLQKDPAKRYSTCEELLADLNACELRQPLPSGADVLDSEDESKLDESVSPTPLQMAQFEQAVVAAVAGKKAQGWIRRLWHRLLDRVEERAPEYLDYLQNTQQQIDRAIDNYGERRGHLLQVISEAESLLKDFESQKGAWEEAGREAREKCEAVVDDLEKNRYQADVDRFEQEARNLERQVSDQSHQLEELRTELSKVVARWESLKSQRDTLNARFEVALAKLRMSGGAIASEWFWHRWFRVLPRPWMRNAAAISIAVLVCYTLLFAIRHMIPGKSSADSQLVDGSDTESALRVESVLGEYQSGLPFDVLKLNDLQKAFEGTNWILEEGELKSSSRRVNLLKLPYTPPRNYLLRAKVERKSGDSSLVIGFRVGAKNTSFILDGWFGAYSGLNLVDRQEAKNAENETRVSGPLVTTGQAADLQIIVVENQILIALNDKIVVDWQGEIERLSSPISEGKYSDQFLTLSSESSAWSVSSLEVVPLDPRTDPGMNPSEEDSLRFPLRQLTGHSGSIRDITVSPNGENYLSAGEDGIVRFWDRETGMVTSTVDFPLKAIVGQGVSGITMSDDGRRLVIGGGIVLEKRKAIAVWDLTEQRMLSALDSPPNMGNHQMLRERLILISRTGRLLHLHRDTGYLNVWSSVDGKFVGQISLMDHFGRDKLIQQRAYVISDDGSKVVAVDSNGWIYRSYFDGVYSLTTPEAVGQIPGWNPEDSHLSRVAVSSDGKHVALTTSRKMPGETEKPVLKYFLSLWEISSGKLVLERGTIQERALDLSFSPDGTRLVLRSDYYVEASRQWKDRIRVWDVNEKTQICRMDPQTRTSLTAIAPDNSRMITAGTTSLLFEWDISATTKIVRETEQRFEGIAAFDVLGNSNRVVIAQSEKIGTWNPSTKEPIQEVVPLTSQTTALDIAPNGKLIVTSDVDGGVTLWTFPEGTKRRQMSLNLFPDGDTTSRNRRRLVNLQFTSDNRSVVIAATDQIIFWDVETGAENIRFQNLPEKLDEVAISADRRYLVTAGYNASEKKKPYRLWDFATGQPLGQIAVSEANTSVSIAVSPDSRRLALGLVGKVEIYEIESRKKLSEFQIVENPDDIPREYQPPLSSSAPTAIAISDEGLYLAAGMNGRIHIFNLESGEELLRFRDVGTPQSIKFSPDTRFVFCVDNFRLLSSESKLMFRTWDLHDHSNTR